jgi:hypothetical protein
MGGYHDSAEHDSDDVSRTESDRAVARCALGLSGTPTASVRGVRNMPAFGQASARAGDHSRASFVAISDCVEAVGQMRKQEELSHFGRATREWSPVRWLASRSRVLPDAGRGH